MPLPRPIIMPRKGSVCRGGETEGTAPGPGAWAVSQLWDLGQVTGPLWDSPGTPGRAAAPHTLPCPQALPPRIQLTGSKKVFKNCVSTGHVQSHFLVIIP